MSRPIVVFDLDGTLIDTAPDLLDSLNHALITGGLSTVDRAALRRHVGFGGRVMIERAFAAQSRPLTNEQLERLLEVFLEHYSTGMPGKSAPYHGVLDALARFEQAGFLLAICTNKTEKLAKSLMQALRLDHRFAAICGADTFQHRKPDPRHLLETIAMAEAEPSLAIMVGDSRADIDAAKAAGVPVVAVDFGYTDRHVREFEPSKVISHFDELTVELARALMARARG
jgi:phosphoglycolate phosphatase